MSGRATLHRWADVPLEKVTEMVARKSIDGPEQIITQAYLKKGALVPLHAHTGEQLIYVLQGALSAVIDGSTITVREGEVLRVASGAAHQAEALDDTFLLDIRARA